jgi:hypothetical protein
MEDIRKNQLLTSQGAMTDFKQLNDNEESRVTPITMSSSNNQETIGSLIKRKVGGTVIPRAKISPSQNGASSS